MVTITIEHQLYLSKWIKAKPPTSDKKTGKSVRECPVEHQYPEPQAIPQEQPREKTANFTAKFFLGVVVTQYHRSERVNQDPIIIKDQKTTYVAELDPDIDAFDETQNTTHTTKIDLLDVSHSSQVVEADIHLFIYMYHHGDQKPLLCSLFGGPTNEVTDKYYRENMEWRNKVVGEINQLSKVASLAIIPGSSGNLIKNVIEFVKFTKNAIETPPILWSNIKLKARVTTVERAIKDGCIVTQSPKLNSMELPSPKASHEPNEQSDSGSSSGANNHTEVSGADISQCVNWYFVSDPTVKEKNNKFIVNQYREKLVKRKRHNSHLYCGKTRYCARIRCTSGAKLLLHNQIVVVE